MPKVERVLGDFDRRDEVTVEGEEIGSAVSEFVASLEGSVYV